MFGLSRKESARFEAVLSEPVSSGGQHPPIVVQDRAMSGASFDHAPVNFGWHDGDKFAGGFGATQVLSTDYWTLRQRSAQLFKTNSYARGIIRRLITNVVNTGLHLEATPKAAILGIEQSELDDWTEEVETRFSLWCDTPECCDRSAQSTFGQIQRQVYEEALIDGDVLVVMSQSKKTRLPVLRVIPGSAVQSPIEALKTGNRIDHGVERDAFGRHVAYWVRQRDGELKRLPAWGEKTGRRLAWLVYATDRRVEDVRGEPILAIALQALREIDRYKDAVLRKALLGSLWLAFIEKGEDKPASRFMSRSGVGSSSLQQNDNSGKQRRFSALNLMPGLIAEELQHGETVKLNGSTSTDEKFSDFEAAILYAIGWALEIPPEILTLSFNSNYSASQAATQEFKMFLDPIRTILGSSFCAPVYQDWLTSEVLNGKVAATGLLDSMRDPSRYDELAAWFSSSWSGHVKPSIDQLKHVKALGEALDRGLISFDQASREYNGSKFSENIKKQKRERAMALDAGLPLEQPVTESQSDTVPTGDSTNQTSARVFRVLSSIQDTLEDHGAMLDERITQ